MTEAEILIVLKIDLQISTARIDVYLRELIRAARSFLRAEGIALEDSRSDGLLVEMYAAYLYRKRREENAVMPRMLRWAINNRLFSQKARNGDG